jgi:hypothetical protein
MIELVIKERRIALPLSRLAWYARWFGIPCKRATVAKIANKMVADGRLVKALDGRHVYYKNRRR